MGNIS